MINICRINDNIVQAMINFFFFVKMYIIFEIFKFYQTAHRRLLDMVLQQCQLDHLFYWKIYHKFTKPRTSLHGFKAKLRKCNVEICECGLHKHYEGNLGFN